MLGQWEWIILLLGFLGLLVWEWVRIRQAIRKAGDENKGKTGGLPGSQARGSQP